MAAFQVTTEAAVEHEFPNNCWRAKSVNPHAQEKVIVKGETMWPKLLIILMLLSLTTCGGFASNGLSQESFTVPSDWRHIDLGRMVLSLPRAMDRREVTGINSQLWESAATHRV
jgi:hypothetical protein